MRFFNSLPNISITDVNNNTNIYKNLLVRTELLPKLASNPLIFYKYSIQDGDTPEIIADKYYGDVFRYWMVLYGNPNIMDPQWDWPLSTNQFVVYLQNKYSAVANGVNNVLSYTQGTVHHYEKIVTTIDGSTGTQAIKVIEVDEPTYLSIMPEQVTQTFPDGSSVTYSVSSSAVSIYDYEVNTNQAKRDINIINSNYVTDLESQYNALVNS
jgi:DNA-directed RNA polymerase subunit H (RpoH/RPB5)